MGESSGVNSPGGSRSVGGSAFIGHIGDVTAVSIGGMIVNNLNSTVWKSNPVWSRGRISVSLLILFKFSTTIIVSYAVLVSVGGGGVVVLFMSIGGGSCRDAKSSRDEGSKNNNSLKI